MIRKVFGLALSGLLLFGYTACQNSDKPAGNENDKQEKRAKMDSIFAALPNSQGLVSDFEGLLSDDESSKLSNHLIQINTNTQFEATIVSTASIAPFEDIMSYATALGNKWEVGNTEDNNGLVIVVSSNMGKAAIATGNGVEDIFTDQVTREIIENRMIPHFTRGDFYAGLERALREIEKKAEKN